jgi:non-homologous end joining protein Ku
LRNGNYELRITNYEFRVAVLEPPTRQAANQYLTPLALSTEEMFASFREFSVRTPLLSVADRSTIAIARHQLLICASDDGLVVETCKVYGITYTRTLRLLAEMVETGHKTVIEVTTMADSLINERGKHISPKGFDRLDKKFTEVWHELKN